MMYIKEVLLHWLIIFVIKGIGGAVSCAQIETSATLDKFVIKNEIMSNQQLGKELHKPNIRNKNVNYIHLLKLMYFGIQKNEFKIDNHVKISKYKNILAKGYARNWFQVFTIKKLNTVL